MTPKAATGTPNTQDVRLARTLVRWFRRAARELPWRTPTRDPWHALVSETMLQQTQVARVIERFEAFIARFPTPETLAQAHEDEVLAAWAGLGYYRRARALHAAARQIVQHHAGHVPHDTHALLELKGVGRYTAGAIASIAFGRPEPIVDGNVQRVLLRLEGKPLVAGSKPALQLAWNRAEALVHAAHDPARFNEALMELGATVCTPRSPRCSNCPIPSHCRAAQEGSQETIPSPKAPAVRTVLHADTILLKDARGRIRIEQRPPAGLWAGLWQLPTLERPGRAHTHRQILNQLARPLGIRALEPIADFGFITTHRDVRFRILRAERVPGARPTRGRWSTRTERDRLAFSNAQRRAFALADLTPPGR